MACSDQEPKVQVESQGYGNDGLRGEIETMKVLNAISPLVPQAFRPKLRIASVRINGVCPSSGLCLC